MRQAAALDVRGSEVGGPAKAERMGDTTMKTTRRRVLQGGAAAASLATFNIRTRRSFGQSGVVRFVPHGDVRSLDPIWTTANMSA
jgi:hypothetical protein